MKLNMYRSFIVALAVVSTSSVVDAMNLEDFTIYSDHLLGLSQTYEEDKAAKKDEPAEAKEPLPHVDPMALKNFSNSITELKQMTEESQAVVKDFREAQAKKKEEEEK